ncbi:MULTISPECIES: hypothetical protein [Lolliginicoccus]|uniref:Uncharacterized protein n=1 Tax=Lolliginicoccus lacisalsi TaxID=2742202 RepID=A0A927JA75_9ACTN|nr:MULTISPECIES: hypothetical protein [Lolliginicoccus]MBD8505420.1 hypothetical protein [Lolliginicoccus lacisalsi]
MVLRIVAAIIIAWLAIIVLGALFDVLSTVITLALIATAAYLIYRFFAGPRTPTTPSTRL